MVDTVRRTGYLLGSEFQDGQPAGSITPQDMRDLIVSLAQHDVLNVLDFLPAGQPDGTTDNTAGIQTAITAAAGKAKLYFPAVGQNYVIATQAAPVAPNNNLAALVLPSNTHLVIDGTIKLVSSALSGVYAAMLYANQATNVLIDGDGTIDGNKAGQSGSHPADFVAGIIFDTCTRGAVNGLIVQNTTGHAVSTFGSSDILLNRVRLLNGVYASQFAGSPGVFPSAKSDNCWILDSYSAGSSDWGFAFYDGVTNSGAIGCVFENYAGPVGILTDGGFFLMSDNILISKCLMKNNAGGISSGVDGTAVGHGSHAHVTIEGNIIHGSSQQGLLVNNTNYLTATNNQVYSCTDIGCIVDTGTTNFLLSDNDVSACSYGMHLKNTATRGSVRSNTIFNCANVGIILDDTTSRIAILNNHLYDTQGTPSQVYGIQLHTGTSMGAGMFVANNVITEATTAALSLGTIPGDAVIVPMVNPTPDPSLSNLNIRVGTGALPGVTSGAANTCVGQTTGQAIVTSSDNTYIGAAAGLLFTGGQITVLGSTTAGAHAGSASGNTCIGYGSGWNITNGAANTILGQSVGSTTLTTGSHNILIGVNENTDTAAAGTSDTLLIQGSGTTPAITGTTLGGTPLIGLPGKSLTIGVIATDPTITSGLNAPSATQPNGSLYLRTNGGASTRLYVSEGGGTWAPITSA